MHHGRFYSAAALGILLWFGLRDQVAEPLRLLIAGDGFFVVYLTITAFFLTTLTPARMRIRSQNEDEGILIIHGCVGVTGLFEVEISCISQNIFKNRDNDIFV